MSVVSKCVDELLHAGLEDFIQAAEVVSIAYDVGRAATAWEARDLALRMVREVLMAGQMEIGDLKKEGFIAWDLEPDEALTRVEQEWSPPYLPALGEFFWLHNTKLGDVHGGHVERHAE